MKKGLIISIIIAFFNASLLFFNACEYILLNNLCNPFIKFWHSLALSNVFWGVVFVLFVQLSFVLVFFLSLFGIFLAVKNIKYKRSLATVAVVFNSINLMLSFFIAWLLFGLAKGL